MSLEWNENDPLGGAVLDGPVAGALTDDEEAHQGDSDVDCAPPDLFGADRNNAGENEAEPATETEQPAKKGRGRPKKTQEKAAAPKKQV